MATATPLRMTPDEYLAFERASTERHEYVNGEIFAMAGSTLPHDQICANVSFTLMSLLGDRPCQFLTSNMRIGIPDGIRFFYSDGLVSCGELELRDHSRDTLKNPLVVFEVLSSSTEANDRGAKFKAYTTIPSLREIVLVSQTEALVEVYTRQPDDAWLRRDYVAGAHARLEALDAAIPVDRLYARVEFPQPEALGVVRRV